MKHQQKTAKRALNVVVDVQLIGEARRLELNMSAVLDRALRDEVARRWQQENANAFEENRKDIEKSGLWSDGRRMW
jgi:antitoxin CcdA